MRIDACGILGGSAQSAVQRAKKPFGIQDGNESSAINHLVIDVFGIPVGKEWTVAQRVRKPFGIPGGNEWNVIDA
jgi:hypothetical protein